MWTLVLSYRTRQSLCFVESDKKNESINKSINEVKKKKKKQKTNEQNKQTRTRLRNSAPCPILLFIIWPGSQDKLTLEALDTIIWRFVVVKA